MLKLNCMSVQLLYYLDWCKQNCSFCIIEISICYWNTFSVNMVILYIILIHISHFVLLTITVLFFIYFRLWKLFLTKKQIEQFSYLSTKWVVKAAETIGNINNTHLAQGMHSAMVIQKFCKGDEEA